MVASTDLTKVRCPTFAIIDALQVGVILSNNGSRVALDSFQRARGTAGYLIGKGASWHYITDAALRATLSEQPMGDSGHLAKLVCNPDVCPKSANKL